MKRKLIFVSLALGFCAPANAAGISEIGFKINRDFETKYLDHLIDCTKKYKARDLMMEYDLCERSYMKVEVIVNEDGEFFTAWSRAEDETTMQTTF